MRKVRSLKNEGGIALVEIIISSAIASLVAIFIGITVTQFVLVRNEMLHTANKTYLAEEGYEVVRLLRDDGWTNLSSLPLQTSHYLQISTTTISITGTPEIVSGKYTRSFLLSPIYRNAADDIVASTTVGANIDDDSRQVTVSVSDSRGTTTMKALFTNFLSL